MDWYQSIMVKVIGTFILGRWFEMDFKRDIYDSLLQWKRSNSGKVLEVSGARQVGKTYILTKFGKENYKNFIYINMMQTSGQEFMICLDKAARWEPGEEQSDQTKNGANSQSIKHLRFLTVDFRTKKIL